MSLKQYFSPQLIKRFHSKHNQKIELFTFSGALRLDMGDLTQSGEVIEKIWKKAFKYLIKKDFQPKSVLVLGFGAGSVAKLISHTWPDAKIAGVEIDPTVVRIARKHFNVDEMSHLTIHNNDAVEFIKNQKEKHDLILVDCYIGDEFPRSLESITFLRKLTELSPNVIINRLFWGQYQPTTLAFHKKLEKHFLTTTTRTASNYLISIKNKGDVGV